MGKKEISREEYEQIKAKYKEYKAIYKQYKEAFEDDDDDKKKHKKDCGCGHKECDCGDNCTCTAEDNCGCDCNGDKKCDCGDNCTCTEEDNCGCGCNGEEHCHCGCHEELTAEQYKQLFAEFQYALAECEKALTKAQTESADNLRIATTYKKDLERYKERNANIQKEAINNAVEDVAVKIIPILDQFEQALNATSTSIERKGFEMIYTSLQKAVTQLGVAEIDALNKPFDSNYHNAVGKCQVKDKKQDGLVTTVYQKGYYITKTNKVIRYAMVEVGEYIK